MFLLPKGSSAITTEGTFNPGAAAMGGGAIALMVIGWIITVILAFIIMLRYMFAYYLAAEGAETVEAFKKSEEMTRGHRGGLFWMIIVLGLFQAAGAIACGIGVFVTGPVAMLAFAHVYLALKGQTATTAGPIEPTPPPPPATAPEPAPAPAPAPEPTPAPEPAPEPEAPAEEQPPSEPTEKAEE